VPKPDLFLKTAWQQSNIKQLLVKAICLPNTNAGLFWLCEANFVVSTIKTDYHSAIL